MMGVQSVAGGPAPSLSQSKVRTGGKGHVHLLNSRPSVLTRMFCSTVKNPTMKCLGTTQMRFYMGKSAVLVA